MSTQLRTIDGIQMSFVHVPGKIERHFITWGRTYGYILLAIAFCTVFKIPEGINVLFF